MKISLTLGLMFAGIIAIAQSNLHLVTHFDFAPGMMYYSPYDMDSREHIKSNKIESLTSARSNKGKTERTVSKYDVDGNLVSRTDYDAKGNLHAVSMYYYNEKKQLILTTGHYKNKTYSTRYFYNDEGVLVETRGYNNKGHYAGSQDIYDVNGNLLSQLVFEKDSVNPYKRLDYTYYEDGSKEAIRYYMEDKLKYTWSFECKESGELVAKKEAETMVCIKEEYDADGNRVVWKQEFNSKGEPQKTKLVYSPDSTLLSCTEFTAEEKMRSHTTYAKDGSYLSQYYDKKGRIWSTYERVYNSEQQIVKVSNTYKKNFGIEMYTYSDGLVTARVHNYTNSYGTHSYRTEYSYTFY